LVWCVLRHGTIFSFAVAFPRVEQRSSLPPCRRDDLPAAVSDDQFDRR
jgi:hypothetical protein